MNTAYFYLTDEGGKLAHKLATAHPGDIYNKENFKENLRAGFGKYDSLVCIMATGIVVRILAPLIVHKTSDPAVVVLDQKGNMPSAYFPVTLAVQMILPVKWQPFPAAKL